MKIVVWLECVDGQPTRHAREVYAMAAATADVVAVRVESADWIVTAAADSLTRIARETGATCVLLPSTIDGNDVAGRVAVRLSAGVVTQVVSMNADRSFEKLVFGDTIKTSVTAAGSVVVATVRAGAVASFDDDIDVQTVVGAEDRVSLVSAQPRIKSARPVVESASIVVAAGRGVGDDQGFAQVTELADVLGAALSGSRPATDAGWIEPAQQVGQTGKTISPDLYVAVGISGAIQHVAGMRSSRTIVAINTDAEAPIFEIADYGIVGDAGAVVPALIDALRGRK